MTREAVLTNMAFPFAKGEQFFCGGVIVNPARVEEVRFSETSQSAGDLLPLIRARSLASGIISVVQDWQVIFEGKDITREILDEATRSAASPQSNSSSVPNAKQERSDRVFIVHGHDTQTLDQTEILIRRFGLTPIILRETPSRGRTVIEKIEAHSDVGFAIVLLTPDDVGGVNSDHLSPRARQNVIWEWGYLVARLGRANVVCLYKLGVEIPSDLHGIVTIHVPGDVREKAEEIRRELLTAGYEIN